MIIHVRALKNTPEILVKLQYTSALQIPAKMVEHVRYIVMIRVLHVGE